MSSPARRIRSAAAAALAPMHRPPTPLSDSSFSVLLLSSPLARSEAPSPPIKQEGFDEITSVCKKRFEESTVEKKSLILREVGKIDRAVRGCYQKQPYLM